MTDMERRVSNHIQTALRDARADKGEYYNLAKVADDIADQITRWWADIQEDEVTRLQAELERLRVGGHIDAQGKLIGCDEINRQCDALRKLTQTCTCYDGNPGNYEGPHADCAVHGAIRAFNEASREIEQLRKRLENAEREADTWWKRSETQVDIIADVRAENERLLTKADNLRLAYELKVADLAAETERVGILAKVLMDDNHSPDGFHAQGDRCRHCAALREALRPVKAVTP